MKYRRLLFAILLVNLVHPVCAQEQEPSRIPGETVAPGTYPDTTEGLKKLMEDILDATSKDDTQTIEAHVRAFVIPNYEDWFRAAFGEEEGSRQSSQYERLAENIYSDFPSRFEALVQQGSWQIQVERIERQPGTAEADRERLPRPTKEAIVLYSVTFNRPDGDLHSSLRYFVYLENGFRYAGTMHIAFPTRIRVGSGVQAAKLIHQVDPEYPMYARNAHIQGTVTIEALIGLDGTLKDLRVVSSPDPILTKAAIKAVRQWRYQPTLLEGRPVEVETVIIVTFKLY